MTVNAFDLPTVELVGSSRGTRPQTQEDGKPGQRFSHAEAMVGVKQRRTPLRSSYGMVITYFDEAGAPQRTVTASSGALHDQSSHETALQGVLTAFKAVPPNLHLVIKCNHRRVDRQLHGLADMADNGWRCEGGTRSVHLQLLQQIYEERNGRANVDFVSPRARRTGPYADALALAVKALNVRVD